MALGGNGIHLLYPSLKILHNPTTTNLQCRPLPSSMTPQSHLFRTASTSSSASAKPQISCTKSSDAELVSDLATEVQKINAHVLQREEAMKKSRELLFTELCQHLGLTPEQLKKKWNTMDDDHKWASVRGFVSEWGANFHPLSATSVKEMVEQHLAADNNHPPPPGPPPPPFPSIFMFPALKKIMGFPFPTNK
ncbi:uncharacterized protein LOC127809585 [Diospyros lotus]|uniref:uncharacterized protein LOC127809585 n=1 Tax=Diospyros lotus TaxID=55363 RepID=UPI00225ABE1F|nr:uncharacterized protein LOC127809585 [Diospyros lotus]